MTKEIGNSEAASRAPLRAQLYSAVQQSYLREYSELSDAWKAADTKAQGGIAVAGIFLAAAFAFARDLDPDLPISWNRVLVGALTLLCISVLFNLAALALRSARTPPAAERLHKIAESVLDREYEGHEVALVAAAFQGEPLEQWRLAVRDVKQVYDRKAKLLLVGQIAVVLAILLATVFTITQTWK